MGGFQRVPHVVIIGGGFAGLYAARALRDAPVRITLIDKRNHHLFQPLLYQVATAALHASDVAAPIRKILRGQENVTVLLAKARGIDLRRRAVQLSDRELPYDHLIVATGATHAYFGHPEWAEHAPGLKTIEDAIAIRRKVLLAYEAAERALEDEQRREWLTFVVVGGGPTGVELAGALGEIAHKTLAPDFRHVDTKETRILLVDGGERILSSYDPELSASAAEQLRELGVEVRTGAIVTGVDDGGVWVGDERIPARTVLWAAGVKANGLGHTLGVPLDRAGRVIVEPDLSIPGHPEVFVAGDLASAQQDGAPVPGVAPAAIQMGRHVAAQIAAAVAGRPRAPFRYRDKGSLATIGRARAVAQFRRARFRGIVAWWLWLVVHIFFLIGFRNRLLVLAEWTWAYWTWGRGSRVILRGAIPGEDPSEQTFPKNTVSPPDRGARHDEDERASGTAPGAPPW